jgi:hypothetical protein
MYSSLVLERSLFDPFGQLFLAGRGLADRPTRGRGPSTRHELHSDSPCVGYGLSAFRVARLVVLLHLTDCPLEGHGPSVQCPRTVGPCPAGPPAWHCARLLSPLLFRVSLSL